MSHSNLIITALIVTVTMEEDDISKSLNFTMVHSEEDMEIAGWRKSEHAHVHTITPQSSWFNTDSVGTIMENPVFALHPDDTLGTPVPREQSENLEEICHALITLHLSTFIREIAHFLDDRTHNVDESVQVYRKTFNKLLTHAGMKPCPVSSGGCTLMAETKRTRFIFEFKVNRTTDEALAEIETYKSKFDPDDRDVLCMGINYQNVEARHKLIFPRDLLVCSWAANLYSNSGTVKRAFPRKELIYTKPIDTKLQSVDDYYRMLENVGEGAFGVVYKCQERRSGKIYAAKVIDVSGDEDRRKDIRLEINIMNQFHHKYLLNLKDAFEEDNKMVLIVEFLSGGQLSRRGRMSESEVIYYVKQICEAVKYMHERNIFHYNISPENIMCRTNQCADIKLIDFGLAAKYDVYVLQSLNSSVGLIEEVFFTGFGFHTDMRDVGLVTYFMLTGNRPTAVEDVVEYINDSKNSLQNISREGKDFIRQLLTGEDEQRMTVHQSLQHPWLKQSSEEVESLITQLGR